MAATATVLEMLDSGDHVLAMDDPDVVAAARFIRENACDGIRVADVLREVPVARSLVGADAVINALGPTTRSREEVSRFETIARNLVAGMRGAGVRRLVDLGGAGITLRGEHKPLGGRIASLIVRAIVPHVVAAKQREYEIIADSDLDWTIVRPPRVTERPATGRTTAGERLAGRSITRDDLARFMVEQLTDTTYVRKAPFVSS